MSWLQRENSQCPGPNLFVLFSDFALNHEDEVVNYLEAAFFLYLEIPSYIFRVISVNYAQQIKMFSRKSGPTDPYSVTNRANAHKLCSNFVISKFLIRESCV